MILDAHWCKCVHDSPSFPISGFYLHACTYDRKCAHMSIYVRMRFIGHACAHLCTLVHAAHTCAHVCTHVHTCSHLHVHTCGHLGAMCIHVHTHAHSCACMCTHVLTCACTLVHTGAHVCMHTCEPLCISVHIDVHICAHT